jgi:hypothetical protein
MMISDVRCPCVKYITYIHAESSFHMQNHSQCTYKIHNSYSYYMHVYICNQTHIVKKDPEAWRGVILYHCKLSNNVAENVFHP